MRALDATAGRKQPLVHWPYTNGLHHKQAAGLSCRTCMLGGTGAGRHWGRQAQHWSHVRHLCILRVLLGGVAGLWPCSCCPLKVPSCSIAGRAAVVVLLPRLMLLPLLFRLVNVRLEGLKTAVWCGGALRAAEFSL